ncbi:hypothetical protein AB1207_23830 [Kineococcus endophyticus]|uniref:Uncharacterized protein n=1 Tax=Kineococcus endophyticus TaxID=1181883 RepID=A0ABV3PDR1_9ACTN
MRYGLNMAAHAVSVQERLAAARTSQESADADRLQREVAADQDREQKDLADRRERWWKRAQWALDLTLDERPGVAATGFNMPTALSQSEWAGVHEDAWITAVTDDVLNNLGGPPLGPYDDADSGAVDTDGGQVGDEDSTRGLLRRPLGWLRGER